VSASRKKNNLISTTNYLFLYFSSDYLPTILTGGKVSYRRIRKILQANIVETNKFKIVTRVMVKGKVINVQDLCLMTIHDPDMDMPIDNPSEICLTNDNVLNVAIPYMEIKKLMTVDDPDLPYESKYVESNWTIMKKESIDDYKAV